MPDPTPIRVPLTTSDMDLVEELLGAIEVAAVEPMLSDQDYLALQPWMCIAVAALALDRALRARDSRDEKTATTHALLAITIGADAFRKLRASLSTDIQRELGLCD